MAQVSKITPFLWYSEKAHEAAQFYCSIFPNSKVGDVAIMNADSPSGPAGSVEVVEFTLFGTPFTAMKAGGGDAFNHSISLVVSCDDQAEVDKYWDELGKGGKYEACGWLRDKYGLAWQITPQALTDMMKSKDKAAAGRAAQAMMKMIKLDIATLQKAFDGK